MASRCSSSQPPSRVFLKTKIDIVDVTSDNGSSHPVPSRPTVTPVNLSATSHPVKAPPRKTPLLWPRMPNLEDQTLSPKNQNCAIVVEEFCEHRTAAWLYSSSTVATHHWSICTARHISTSKATVLILEAVDVLVFPVFTSNGDISHFS